MPSGLSVIISVTIGHTVIAGCSGKDDTKRTERIGSRQVDYLYNEMINFELFPNLSLRPRNRRRRHQTLSVWDR